MRSTLGIGALISNPQWLHPLVDQFCQGFHEPSRLSNL